MTGILVGLLWLIGVLLIPLGQAIMAREWPGFFGFVFTLPISIPAILAIHYGYQLTLSCSKDSVTRTVGCLCIILAMFSASSLLRVTPGEKHDTWFNWYLLVTAILSILLYVVASKRLLRLGGIAARNSELVGEGQLGLIALLLWMALSSINQDYRGDTILVSEISIFGPILAVWLFFKIGRRVLLKAQQSTETN